eukprot:1693230-Pyramimonas_sp.AAC.1
MNSADVMPMPAQQAAPLGLASTFWMASKRRPRFAMGAHNATAQKNAPPCLPAGTLEAITRARFALAS